MKSQRLLSLDILRGITVAGMILVNNPGSWGHIFKPLRHAAWAGCTPTDLVFPFFLFVVGAAMAFSFAKYGESLSKAIINKITADVYSNLRKASREGDLTYCETVANVFGVRE